MRALRKAATVLGALGPAQRRRKRHTGFARMDEVEHGLEDPEPDVHARSLASQLQTLVHICE